MVGDAVWTLEDSFVAKAGMILGDGGDGRSSSFYAILRRVDERGVCERFLIGVFAIHIERIRWMGGVGLLVLVLATGGYAATQGFSHYNERFQISSLDTRRDLWIGAWGLIQEQPILGQGLGAFRGVPGIRQRASAGFSVLCGSV